MGGAGQERAAHVALVALRVEQDRDPTSELTKSEVSDGVLGRFEPHARRGSGRVHQAQ